jgi:hypothetical protein
MKTVILIIATLLFLTAEIYCALWRVSAEKMA